MGRWPVSRKNKALTPASKFGDREQEMRAPHDNQAESLISAPLEAQIAQP